MQRQFCTCHDARKQRGREVVLHQEAQDEHSDAHKRLVDLIADAAAQRVEEWWPGRLMPPEEWHRIAVLPPQIRLLQSVRKLVLYDSSLVRIPPEIGEMSSLEEFVPYTSYRLHWFPYEITRCRQLKQSTISTRALYGNYKFRNLFPDLRRESEFLNSIRPQTCGVCSTALPDEYATRWISLNIATDVVPLLVFACSGRCIDSLPAPPDNYVAKSHRGGRAGATAAAFLMCHTNKAQDGIRVISTGRSPLRLT